MDEGDYLASAAGRRQSWFGLKRHVKRFLGLRAPHAILRGVVRIAPQLRSGRLPAPASLHEVTGRVADTTFVMLHPDRCEIAKELYWGGGRRPRAEDALALEVVSRLARDADVLLDIGAYTGVFSLATTAVNTDLRAHAFEIVPGVARVLRENVERNGVADRVEIHLEGLGEPETSMLVPTGEGGSALPSFYSSRMHFEGGTRVGFRSLDSMIEPLGGAARVVMKIDVEGTEDQVFRFGQAFIERYRPDMLCEVLPSADGALLESLLAPGAFHTYLVREQDLVRRSPLAPDERFRDWLLTPREPDQLRALGIPVG
ncbi:MAG TPA: FkbM family methyltransferase [Actinomycetota bacterium]|nr:FkbM family methyltransferase [Actinomycetota bacterium]